MLDTVLTILVVLIIIIIGIRLLLVVAYLALVILDKRADAALTRYAEEKKRRERKAQ